MTSANVNPNSIPVEQLEHMLGVQRETLQTIVQRIDAIKEAISHSHKIEVELKHQSNAESGPGRLIQLFAGYYVAQRGYWHSQLNASEIEKREMDKFIAFHEDALRVAKSGLLLARPIPTTPPKPGGRAA